MNATKVGGIIITLGSVPLGIFTRDWPLFQVTLCFGLMMQFFAKERINDERVEQLKMKALFMAMSVGLGFSMIAQYYLYLIFPALRWNPEKAYQPLSVYEFLSAVFLIALGLFHYWRWQDGRVEKSG
jgi:FtsH-binding integral membrane protein